MDVTKGTSLITTQSTYDTWKDIITIVFPGAGALYAGLALIWGFPFAEEVVGTIALIVTFGSILLKVASKQYENAQPAPPLEGGMVVVNTTSISADPVSASFTVDPLTLPTGTDLLMTVRNDSNPDELPDNAPSQD
jgi:hypothetical protein